MIRRRIISALAGDVPASAGIIIVENARYTSAVNPVQRVVTVAAIRFMAGQREPRRRCANSLVIVGSLFWVDFVLYACLTIAVSGW